MSDQPAITITRVPPRSIAGIGAFRDRAPLLAALQAAFGAAVPTTSRFVQAGAVAVSCLAPSRYVATGNRDADLPMRLAQSLSGLAAITDQSDMWAIFAVSGPQTREVLARVVPIDLDEEQFRVGDVALTRAGHLDVRLWRVAVHSYELAVTRSTAGDLHSALSKQSFFEKKDQKTFIP